MNNQWISVEDKLPEDYKVYKLVWLQFPQRRELNLGYYLDGKWRVKEYYEEDVSRNVTHWMELPSPPEIGGAE